MRIDRVSVAVVVGMGFAVAVVMGMRLRYEFKRPILAEAGAISARIAVVTFLRAHAFNMMVVTFLNRADFRFKAQNGCAIFTHLTIHSDVTCDDLFDAFDKSFNHCRMVVQIGRF